MSKRVLVTGSRAWTDREAIRPYLEYEFEPGAVLVSGACPKGADRICEELAESIGYRLELHPADWQAHGKRAGFVRNQEMVDLGADVCLAFISNHSRGATHTAGAAEAAGIPTYRFEVADE